MRLARLAGLSLACLLALAATAHADATWELWVRKDYDAGLTRGWRTVATFTARTECPLVTPNADHSSSSHPMEAQRQL